MPKCIECGYLAVRDEYNNDVCEATEFTRQKGLHKSSQGNSTPANLFCYVDSEAFQKPKIRNAYDPDYDEERDSVLAIINREHNCEKVTRWWPGKSPERHEEMDLLRKVEAQSAKNTQMLEALYETRHQELRRDSERRFRINLVVSILSVIVAAVMAYVAARIGLGAG